MTLGKLVLGYWLGKNAEKSKEKRRKRFKLLLKPVSLPLIFILSWLKNLEEKDDSRI